MTLYQFDPLDKISLYNHFSQMFPINEKFKIVLDYKENKNNNQLS